MGDIARIVTHHVDTRGAAEAWIRDGICAIGFVYNQNRVNDDRESIKEYMQNAGRNEKSIPSDAGSFIQFRDDVQIGDFVFAYATVTGGYAGLATRYIPLKLEILLEGKYNIAVIKT